MRGTTAMEHPLVTPLRRRRTLDGFTLVELLVVIGIIALLIGILMPALSKARESARQVQCLSNIRQLSTAVISFTAEHKGWMPRSEERRVGKECRMRWSSFLQY